MSKIIRFPKNERASEFFKFTVRYDDGVEFKGSSLEEAFRKQKDVFEPECSFNEYIEHLRDRLIVITGKFYDFNSIDELTEILKKLDIIEVSEDFGELEIIKEKK